MYVCIIRKYKQCNRYKIPYFAHLKAIQKLCIQTLGVDFTKAQPYI